MLRKKIASIIAPIIVECEECGADVYINVNKKNQKCPRCGTIIKDNQSDEKS